MSGQDPSYPGNGGYRWPPHTGNNELELGGYGATVPGEHYDSVYGANLVGTPGQFDSNPYAADAVKTFDRQHSSHPRPTSHTSADVEYSEGRNEHPREQVTKEFVQSRQNSFERREACRHDGVGHHNLRMDKARRACEQCEEHFKKGGRDGGSSCKPEDKNHRPHDHGGGRSGSVVLNKASSSKDPGDKESKSKEPGGQGARAKESRDKQLRKESKNKDSKSEGSKSKESKTKGSGGRSR